MILIGYDGIGHAPLLFPYQPALFGFLECLKGCRPLITLLPILTPSQGTTADSWSMVFRLQSSDTPTPPPSPHSSDTPTQPPSPHFRDTPTPQPSPPHSSDTPTPPPPPPHSSDSPVDNHVAMDTTLSVDLKEVQVKVSRHLLMQHFYSCKLVQYMIHACGCCVHVYPHMCMPVPATCSRPHACCYL